MPPKKLTSKALEALGTERLAELLLELAQEDAATRRRLRYALAQTGGTDELAREVRKRLAAMRRARSFVDLRRAGQRDRRLARLRVPRGLPGPAAGPP